MCTCVVCVCAVHVGDALLVRALRAAAARRRQGALLRRAQEVPRLPQRPRGAHRRGRARLPRQHEPPPAGGDGDQEVCVTRPRRSLAAEAGALTVGFLAG